MAELAYASDLKSDGRNLLRVRSPLTLQKKENDMRYAIYYNWVLFSNYHIAKKCSACDCNLRRSKVVLKTIKVLCEVCNHEKLLRAEKQFRQTKSK